MTGPRWVLAADPEDPFVLANRVAGPRTLATYPTVRLVRCLLLAQDSGRVPPLPRVHGWSLDDLRGELRRRERGGSHDGR